MDQPWAENPQPTPRFLKVEEMEKIGMFKNLRAGGIEKLMGLYWRRFYLDRNVLSFAYCICIQKP
jgi:hypothetical protein